jgi:hypothetical protein
MPVPPKTSEIRAVAFRDWERHLETTTFANSSQSVHAIAGGTNNLQSGQAQNHAGAGCA